MHAVNARLKRVSQLGLNVENSDKIDVAVEQVVLVIIHDFYYPFLRKDKVFPHYLLFYEKN